MLRRSAIFLLATVSLFPIAVRAADAPTPKAVLTAYSDLALAMYGDALTAARQLDTAVEALLATPSEATLAAARDAWKAARVPYMQTEVLSLRQRHRRRLGGPGERLAARRGPDRLCRLRSYGDEQRREPALHRQRDRQPEAPHRAGRGRREHDHAGAAGGKLQEAHDVEKNVATGYHAIEFLLWGQDLNGTGPGAGDRPATDYARAKPAPTATATAAAPI